MTTDTQEPEVTDAPAGGGDAEASSAEPARPGAFDRYVVPLLMPVAIGATVLFWVLNLSRILLAAEGTGAVVAGIVITVVILGGAAALAAAPRLKSSSASLMASGALVVVLVAGLVTIGAAEEDEEEGEVSLGEPIATVAVESGNLYFKPEELGPVPPGVIEIDVDNVSGGHTFVLRRSSCRSREQDHDARSRAPSPARSSSPVRARTCSSATSPVTAKPGWRASSPSRRGLLLPRPGPKPELRQRTRPQSRLHHPPRPRRPARADRATAHDSHDALRARRPCGVFVKVDT